MTFIANKLLRKQAEYYQNSNLRRAARSFDWNNQERVINDVTGRLSSNPWQRLAIAQSLGLATGQNLIIGGQRDGGVRRGDAPTLAGEQAQFGSARAGLSEERGREQPQTRGGGIGNNARFRDDLARSTRNKAPGLPRAPE